MLPGAGEGEKKGKISTGLLLQPFPFVSRAHYTVLLCSVVLFQPKVSYLQARIIILLPLCSSSYTDQLAWTMVKLGVGSVLLWMHINNTVMFWVFSNLHLQKKQIWTGASVMVLLLASSKSLCKEGVVVDILLVQRSSARAGHELPSLQEKRSTTKPCP